MHPTLPLFSAAPRHTALPRAPALDLSSLYGVLDALDTGVLLSDAHGHVLLVNDAARQELADGGVLQLSADGALDVVGGSGVLALRRAVLGAATAHSHHLVPLRVGDRGLMLSVQPLASGGAVAAGSAEASLVLLLLGRRSLCHALLVQRLASLFALTPGEQSVLFSLLQGERIRDVAEARQVKLSTVRTQVAALRAKFGVSRVDDITRLAAELPPLRGALRKQLSAPSPGPAAVPRRAWPQ